MTNAADWQGAVGRSWAAEWERTDRSLAELNTRLVDRAHFSSIAAPGAQLVFSCFRDRSENAWASDVPALLPVPPAPMPRYAPGPFAFADPDHVRTILTRAGWKDARAEPVDFSFVSGVGEDPVADAIDYFSRIGPAAPLIRDLEEREKAALIDRLSQLLCNRLANGTVSFDAAAWIWSAHK